MFSPHSYGFRPGRSAHQAIQKSQEYIRAYLGSGVMVNGVVMDTEEGTLQGGPLSPFLSNIMLNDLDRELEKCGHKFVR